jgi:ubiquinone/menaquinone biosynthesis C-methylase UbiE
MSASGRIFAACYDRMMSRSEKAGLRASREELLADAHGRVLEIGGGTGANLPFYGSEVEELTITEPEEPMARKLERQLRQSANPAVLVRASAEDLPFEDGYFDVAVSTLVLCTVSDQARALSEIRRVLNPEGRLLFIEHVRSADRRLARWQDRLNGLQRRIAAGCNCNRATLNGIHAAGFTIMGVSHEHLRKAPPIVRPLVLGTALASSRAVQPVGAAARASQP